MSIVDITLAGAYAQATSAADKCDQRALVGRTTTISKSQRSESLASVMAWLYRVFAQAPKAAEGAGPLIKTLSHPV
jgi:hypothetical protein